MKSNSKSLSPIAILIVLLVIFNSCAKEEIRYASDTKKSALLPNGFEDVTGYFNAYGEKNTNQDPIPMSVYLVTYDAQFNKLKAYKKYGNDGQKIGDLEWDGEYTRATMNIKRYFVTGSTAAILDIKNKDEMTINSNAFSEQIRMVRRIANSY
jgi:hypothetical protein